MGAGAGSRVNACATSSSGPIQMRKSNERPSASAGLLDTLLDVGRAGGNTGRQMVAGVVWAGRCVNDVIAYAREPGRPLDIVSTVARKAPLSSLLITLVIGISIGRRR